MKAMEIKGFLKGGSWQEEACFLEVEGVKVTRVSETWTLTGGLEGSGEAFYLLAYAPDGTVKYTGYERLEGIAEGRRGTILVETQGVFDQSGAHSTWRVEPSMCTGDFAGVVSGEGGYEASGHDPAPLELRLKF